MDESKRKPDGGTPDRPDRTDRTGRLAEALRENLRRRKAQARARAQARRGGAGIAPEPPGGDPETAARSGEDR